MKETFQNDLFLRASNGEITERPPIWIMRQAGRILPQYRALREKFPDFKAFVKTPDAAAEATIQPIDELGMDAAIVFSDILTVPEAMGLNYEMVEKVGPRFPKTIESRADVESMRSGEEVIPDLEYVANAIRATKTGLAGRVPLIGFAGAPWTIFAYMIEGGGSKTFSKARRFLYTDPEASQLLLDKITDTTILYLKEQIKAGANLVQIFDSWAGMLSPEQYAVYAMPCFEKICNAIDEVPITVFAKGAWFALPSIGRLDCQVVGLDWNTHPKAAKLMVEGKTLQGNLDPCVLYAKKSEIERETRQMVEDFKGVPHIVNLGHGVYPDTPLDGVRAFVDCVKSL